MKRFTVTCFICLLCLYSTECEAQKSEVQEIPIYLSKIDSLFKDLPRWLGSLYHPESGGFYINSGLRKMREKYGPDIQSTSMALSMLLEGGLDLNDIPKEKQKKIVEYLQSHQDPASGLFIDRYYPSVGNYERLLGRLLSFSLQSLKRLGAKPLYPVQEKKPDNTGVKLYESPGTVQKWLDQLTWTTNVWTALDAISSQKSILQTLPSEQQNAYVKQIYDYAVKKQYDDGLWGNGQELLVRISGTVKFSWFCRDFKLSLPKADRIYHQVINWYKSKPSLRKEFQRDATFPGNPIRLLGELELYLPHPFPETDMAVVVKESYLMINYFLEEDGGFARHVGRYFIRPNDLPSMGELREPTGDVNGSSQIFHVRRWAYHLTRNKMNKIPCINEFVSAINRK